MGFNKHSGKQNLEFGGVIGASFLIFVLPATMMAINIACNEVFIFLYVGIIGQFCIFLTV